MGRGAILALLVWIGTVAAIAAQTVPAERIRDEVRSFLRTRFEGTQEEIEITFREGQEGIVVPSGNVHLRVASEGNGEYRGSCTVVVELSAGGKLVKAVPVQVRVRTFGRLLVAKSRIERHARMTSSDFESRRVETTGLRTDWVRSPEAVETKRTRRMIGPGSVLYESMLERIPVVFQGDRVTLRVVANGVTLSVQAIAREDGYAGESITVQRLDAHARVQARVAGPDIVEIAVN
jgi:flagella basal body P-ring formation protein FlgA